MVATVSIKVDHGGSDGSPGTSTDIDALGPPAFRFKTADGIAVDTSNPVPIPTAGTNYSYWAHFYLFCDVGPDTQIDNLKFYSDGSGFGTGITLNVGDQFPTKNSGSSSGYELATGTPGTTGDEIVANHSGISSVTDVFSLTSGSPLSGPSISEDSSVINASGETSDYLVLQLAVANTASPGNKTDETLTIQYDEI